MNQKIATKTISRLGFSVSATWNGKEALDYLVETTKGNHKKPDIILMDVQMPVIDGYKATHLMRHHLPYKNLVKNVPIVAMTASAIQGDREKCIKAGMDDYLSKPVTIPLLESMLLRWSATKRRVRSSPAPSACSEQSGQCENADIPHVGLEDDDYLFGDSLVTPRPLNSNGAEEPSPFDSPIRPELAALVQQPEGEKEWTSRLQNTKLIDAAGGPSNLRSDSYRDRAQSSGEALTEENVNKLKNDNQKQEGSVETSEPSSDLRDI